jgi:uncharacterized membrane protein
MVTLSLAAGSLLALLQQTAAPVADKGMSSAHFVYIPGSIILGIVIGYVLGARAAQAAAAAERTRAAARAARKQQG